MQQLYIIIFTLLILNTGCGGKLSEEDRKAIAETKERREFKKIKEADIIATASQKGRDILQLLEEYLNPGHGRDSTTIDPSTGKLLLSDNDIDIIDSLSRSHATDITFISAVDASALEQASPKEKEVFEAYLYNVEEGLEMRDNIQKINDSTLLYTRPLLRPLMEVLQEKDSVSRDFSDKKAMAGMWSLRISRKEIIRRF